MRDRPFYELLWDIRHSKIPQVTWIVPPSHLSEHGDYLPAAGEDHTNQILQALWSNPKLWAKTALILNYDENDGLFDHAAPPVPPPGTPDEYVNGMPIGLGFRVPCMVISPFSHGGYVSSRVFDHTSVLRLLETRFGVEIPNITKWRRETCGGCCRFRLDAPPRFRSFRKMPQTGASLADGGRARHGPEATRHSPSNGCAAPGATGSTSPPGVIRIATLLQRRAIVSRQIPANLLRGSGVGGALAQTQLSGAGFCLRLFQRRLGSGLQGPEHRRDAGYDAIGAKQSHDGADFAEWRDAEFPARYRRGLSAGESRPPSPPNSSCRSISDASRCTPPDGSMSNTAALVREFSIGKLRAAHTDPCHFAE